MKAALLDLAAEHREIEGEIAAALREVTASGCFVLGPQVAAFEREFARFVGVAHAVAVASGTDALHLALRAAGIGPGDEVVCPAFCFVATAEAICHAGARPVFADVDPATFNLDPDCVERAITPATRGVIAVHLFGQCADLERLGALCAQRNLVLIEDCAQAAGATFDCRSAGAWGRAGCFSFYPSKNLGGYGDGGIVTTADEALAGRLRMLRHHGSRERYRHEIIGYNSRLDELQAAVLRVKLRRLSRWNEARRAHAAVYRRRLAGTPLGLPAEHGRGLHVYHQFTVRWADRDALREALAAAGVESGVYYSLPLNRQPVFATEWAGRPFPAAERAAAEVLSLPVHPQLAPDALDHVCMTLAAATARMRV